MDDEETNVYTEYANFPPLYTEQINDLVLSKQLEIWESIVRRSIAKHGAYIINEESNEKPPFYNPDINRKVKRSFMVLIGQHLIERGYGFYIHSIKRFCIDNGCTIWYALCLNKDSKNNKLCSIHDQKYQTFSKVKAHDTNITTLKRKRDKLESDRIELGIFPKTLDETGEQVLDHVKSKLAANQVETLYFLFFWGGETTKRYNSWAEEHIAFILATLVQKQKIAIIPSDPAFTKTLSSKQVGVQLL
ncbi:ESCRT-II complex subunit family protein [Babesia bovis T2Bo]|uniref:Uncharacterized protein n=1 Tax=Babesia bovis TaxID=5865 RepID=A7AWW6_BABBO|nr:ESCRT-II complex subunit family protein [Babesia bovis T2Bo]EDO05544.1 ESCRT-II complex subunit family protein [Babesia bovis T2Bo]|eukprot:XP_001609112.1 hypothetical protein [Babesia bovis T2Bo]